MLKISIVYTGGLRPLSLIANEYPTISDFLRKWITDPANNIMVRASEGGVLISKRDIETLTLEQFDASGNLARKVTLNAGDLSGLSLEYAVKISEGNEEMGEVISMTPGEEIVQESSSELEDVLIGEPYLVGSNTSPIEEEIEMVEEAEVQEDQEVVKEETPSIPAKAQNFREKFLDRENKADTFENSIIEKMDRRIAKLENFAKVLDGENDYLDEFTAEKLGK